jgi:hypothetical protein
VEKPFQPPGEMKRNLNIWKLRSKED